MQRVSFDRVDFFLGATTPAGFKGYFEPLRREPGMQMVLIKSGPGCGKSTLMKQLARRAIQQGEPVECIHCASDPDSFDGVIFCSAAPGHRRCHRAPHHRAGCARCRRGSAEPVPYHSGRRPAPPC